VPYNLSSLRAAGGLRQHPSAISSTPLTTPPRRVAQRNRLGRSRLAWAGHAIRKRHEHYGSGRGSYTPAGAHRRSALVSLHFALCLLHGLWEGSLHGAFPQPAGSSAPSSHGISHHLPLHAPPPTTHLPPPSSEGGYLVGNTDRQGMTGHSLARIRTFLRAARSCLPLPHHLPRPLGLPLPPMPGQCGGSMPAPRTTHPTPGLPLGATAPPALPPAYGHSTHAHLVWAHLPWHMISSLTAHADQLLPAPRTHISHACRPLVPIPILSYILPL